jgi:riboflavin kinase/FMN adenylyltransferase
MRIAAWDEFLSGGWRIEGPVGLTIGVFDGVHLGHRKLLSEVTGSNTPSVVVTFRENPALVLSGRDFPGSLLSFRQKLSRLESLGVDYALAIDFSNRLSKLSGRAFIELLRQHLTLEKIAVGYDFRFGRDKDTDAVALRALFMDSETAVRVTEPVLYKGSAVSSSRIRGCIRDGELAEARGMLGADHCLDLRDVVPAPRRNGDNRIVSIRKSDIRQCLPEKGSYPVSCEAEAASLAGLLTIHTDTVELELESGGKILEARFL